jgi:hypothetical protein
MRISFISISDSKMKRFLGKTVFYVIIIVGGFELLYRAGFLPVVTDSTYFDHKMAWVRQHPLKQPKLILVGSSVALYGVQSGPIVQQLPLSYFNFCSWRMRISECGMVVPTLVREYRPTYLVLGSNLGDFCGETDYTYLDYTRMPRVLRQQFPELWYFLDFHSVHQIVYRKMKSRTVRFDQWGGGDWLFDRSPANGPLADPGDIPDRIPFDPQNQGIHYRALDSIGRWLRDQQVKLIFVQFPVSDAGASDDSVRALVEQHIRTCQSIIRESGGIFLNYCDSLRGRDSLFAGPIHLKPPGAQVLTRMLVRDLGKIMGGSQ